MMIIKKNNNINKCTNLLFTVFAQKIRISINNKIMQCNITYNT